MDTVKIPTPEKLTKNPTREELFEAFNVFKSNSEYIQSLNGQNFKNYENFINENRNSIKNIAPIKGKVYKVIEKNGWSGGSCSSIDNQSLIKYVLITFIAIRKDVDRWSKFIPTAKAIPLDENGKLIKYTMNCFVNQRDNREYILNEDGREEIYISHLSSEDYPLILLAYKDYLRKKDNKELATFNRLKEKFEKGELS